jgi:hypothetical protein
MALLAFGAACLGLAVWLIYLQVPRRGWTAPKWLASESGSTSAALGSFILLVAGISLIVKGVG